MCREIDSDFLDALAKRIQEDDRKATVANEEKEKIVKTVYDVLTRCTNSKVTCKMHKPFQSMGSVSIEGKDISFSDTSLFALLCGLASNVDIYAKTNGAVKIDLTFHGLATSSN